MCKSKPICCPFISHFKLSWKQYHTNDKDKEDTKKIPYSLVVDSLIYAIIYIYAMINFSLILKKKSG